MTIEQIVLIVLSSSVLGGAVGALIAGRFSLSVKNREYENEYYKLILVKRVAAYESVQALVSGLKTAVVSAEDKQPYHFLLANENSLPAAHKLLFKISSQALWLSDDLFLQTRDLSRLLFGASSYQGGVVAFAKVYYQKLAILRGEVERMHTRDMLSLHEVSAFLKAKKVEAGFSEVRLGG